MINNKPAPTDRPILEVIKNRWSPVAFSDKPLDEETVKTLLEAARWAASSFNEQPWNYVVGHKGDETHKKLGECLMEGNAWAKNAGVLMLSVANMFFAHKHKPNRHGMYDTGTSTGYMFLQATSMDIAMHEMAGFDAEKAREYFKISEDFEPCAMIAIGYPGDHDALEPDQKEREESPRVRRSVEEMIWKI